MLLIGAAGIVKEGAGTIRCDDRGDFVPAAGLAASGREAVEATLGTCGRVDLAKGVIGAAGIVKEGAGTICRDDRGEFVPAAGLAASGREAVEATLGTCG